VPAEAVRIVRSPYRFCPLGAHRFCPLGAHVDHQLGEVTGTALDRALLLAFAPRDDGRVALRSHQFHRSAEFLLEPLPAKGGGDWADYACGAAFALRARGALLRGISAILDGHDNVAGLSSSAAAGVAYLLAFQAASGLEFGPADNIELDRIIENDYIGLNNGILDQSVILLSRPGHLLHLDCPSGRSRLVPLGGGRDVSVAVLFSGPCTPLSQTDYNLRVRECREAAGRLLSAAGVPAPEPPHLRAVQPEAFAQHGPSLPPELHRRARHFFGEQERVRQGVALWQAGDLEGFGRLISESGRSSIENYECGNRYLRTACQVLRECPGVYGARFSGAGFRGCAVALVKPDSTEEVERTALSRYVHVHPDMEGAAELYFCQLGSAAAVLEPGGRV
jgi:galactokinase